MDHGSGTDAGQGPVSWQQLAEVLAAMPDVYQRLLQVHVAAESGRCRACTVPGTGTPGARWPCSVRQLAELAERIDRGRRGPR